MTKGIEKTFFEPPDLPGGKPPDLSSQQSSTEPEDRESRSSSPRAKSSIGQSQPPVGGGWTSDQREVSGTDLELYTDPLSIGS